MTWTPIAPAFLVGMTFSAVTRDEFDGLLAMTVANSERVVRFAHYQDCCEHVRLEDVVGDLDDLIGTPIVVAEEVSSPPGENRRTARRTLRSRKSQLWVETRRRPSKRRIGQTPFENFGT